MTGEQKKQKKEMLVELMSNDLYVPMKIKELAILLQVPKERRQELQEVLDELMLEGKIEVSAKGNYRAKPISSGIGNDWILVMNSK